MVKTVEIPKHRRNIARGTTDPGIASITSIRYKFGHQMVAPSGG